MSYSGPLVRQNVKRFNEYVNGRRHGNVCDKGGGSFRKGLNRLGTVKDVLLKDREVFDIIRGGTSSRDPET